MFYPGVMFNKRERERGEREGIEGIGECELVESVNRSLLL